MARRSESRKMLRQLSLELAASATATGQRLVWSAQEEVVLGQIATMLDRKAELLTMYDATADESVAAKVRLSAECRLLEQAVARMIKAIRTELPKPESLRTIKARHAVNVRWAGDAGA